MRWRMIAVTMLVIVAAAAQPLRLTAQALDDATIDPVGDEPAIERFDSEKFWTYAACAASIVAATGGVGAVLVFIACGRAATLYWTK